MDDSQKTFNADNLPDDLKVSSDKPQSYAPIDPSETYTVQVIKAELRENRFYKPDATKPEDRGSKYQFSFEFAILDDGEFYGRRLWTNTGLAFKPEGKKGPTKLYKIVTCAMKVDMGWDECASFNPDTPTFLRNLEKEVIGRQLKVAIENNTKENKTYSKITTFNRVKKELKPFDPEKSKKMAEKFKPGENKEKVEPKDIPF